MHGTVRHLRLTSQIVPCGKMRSRKARASHSGSGPAIVQRVRHVGEPLSPSGRRVRSVMTQISIHTAGWKHCPRRRGMLKHACSDDMDNYTHD